MKTKYTETLDLIREDKAGELFWTYVFQLSSLIIMFTFLSKYQFTGLENLILIIAVILTAVFAYMFLFSTPNGIDYQKAELAHNLYELENLNKTRREDLL